MPHHHLVLLTSSSIARECADALLPCLTGAAAAFCVGFVHWVCGTRFGLPLILFYLSSSKVGRKVLAELHN